MQKNKNYQLFLWIFVFFVSLCSHSSKATSLSSDFTQQDFTQRQDVQDFIAVMVQKHQFDATQLTQWFKQATPQPTILKTIAKPAEKLPWYKYEPIFITPKRIDEGVVFWQKNANALKKAEKIYGVPAEIIVAIIGVESFYGKRAGQYKVFDALITLGFDYPPRSKFFLSELEEFLLLAREQKWDPLIIQGSYAGAMGDPQFIASSYRRYAVDFSGKGKRDLINNIDDAIGSVANYFKANGWETGKPIAFLATIKGDDKIKNLIASKTNPKPEYTYKALSELGVSLSDTLSKNSAPALSQTFALIALEGKDNVEYWLGAQNFYVITRYNHSDLYAMAVYNLSEKIKEAFLHLKK